ncbi:hypothetical protein PV516_18790 [Streptomyces scabiei]|uniref:hypothetical protein n=1 Tax=Streptomyces scabiei TaxID=1930 RepID=UPI0029BB204E|nr:hypothetical protein [Streptomyces scabiei]MDX3165834.1 hypothetical protein [Streptomyces scabiei]
MDDELDEFRWYKLTPTWIDPDVSGWELEGAKRDCHETFSDIPERDLMLAKRWANEVIGRRRTWRRVEEERGFEHYEASHRYS